MPNKRWREALTGTGDAGPAIAEAGEGRPGSGLRVLLVDHQDSFVHTLADYFRQEGAEVTTLRAGFRPPCWIPTLPIWWCCPRAPVGPDFACDGLLSELDDRGLPAFGVCLGLQAMVEHAGGELSLLASPRTASRAWSRSRAASC